MVFMRVKLHAYGNGSIRKALLPVNAEYYVFAKIWDNIRRGVAVGSGARCPKGIPVGVLCAATATQTFVEGIAYGGYSTAKDYSTWQTM